MLSQNAVRVVLGGALAVAVVACGHADIAEHSKRLRPVIAAGKWDQAAGMMEKAREDGVFEEDDRVMYQLELGTIYHYGGNENKSQQQFVGAEKAMQDLFTKSISGEASKVIVGEAFQDYPGEDHEKVLVYVYTSLNQVRAGKLQDALVEARRADELLKKMAIHYEKEGEGGTVYKVDAFMLWLVALYYEMEGSVNDAYLAYKAAYEAYEADYGKFGTPPPAYMGEDLVRTAVLTGFKDDAAMWKQKTGATGQSLERLAAGMGEVILIQGVGEAPRKKELVFQAPMPDGYVMRMAIPQFEVVNTVVDRSRVSVNGTSSESVLAEPVSEIVLENFKHRLPAIKARAVARAAIKYAATKAAEAAGNQANEGVGALLGLAMNIASAVTETADLRSWTLLPSRFHVARLWLPPGQHMVSIDYLNASGVPVAADQITATVSAGKRSLISVRAVR